MIIQLTAEERQRFSAWLKQDAKADEDLVWQMAKLNLTALINTRRLDIDAKLRVAKILDSTETQTIN